MPLILGANSVSGYTVKNSLRFNSGSSDSLTRTTGTPTSQQKFTWSSWCKRTKIGSAEYNIIQGFYTNANNYLLVGFNQDKIDVINYPNATTARKITTAVFRDVSAWYHIVVAVDTTQATATDRIKIYVNGTQITSFTTDTAPSQNANLLTNATTTAIGVGEGGSIGYHNGYISEIYYIDGQALTPSSFGETDTLTGIWIPKAYTGTYGTNGFELEFKNSASLGTDSSGNGNTFTVNNLTSIDQTTDTPTNNFATLNPLDNRLDSGSGILYPNTLTQGNLNASPTDVTTAGVSNSTIAINGGSFFAEFKVLGISGVMDIGILAKDNWSGSAYPFSTANVGYAYRNSGDKRSSAGVVAYGSSYTTNDIIGIAFDNTNGNLTFYKNGTSQGVAFTGLTSNLSFVFSYAGVSGNTISANFGNPSYSANSYTDGAGYGNFSYAVPSGYYALNTKNLANFG
jgi:hypothetical protein